MNLQRPPASLLPTSLPSTRVCLLYVCTAQKTTALASVTPELRKQHGRTVLDCRGVGAWRSEGGSFKSTEK